MLYFDVRYFCLASDNDIVDVLSLGEPRVDLKRPPIPQDEGTFSRVVLQIHGRFTQIHGRFTGREGVTCHARRL